MSPPRTGTHACMQRRLRVACCVDDPLRRAGSCGHVKTSPKPCYYLPDPGCEANIVSTSTLHSCLPRRCSIDDTWYSNQEGLQPQQEYQTCVATSSIPITELQQEPETIESQQRFPSFYSQVIFLHPSVTEKPSRQAMSSICNGNLT